MTYPPEYPTDGMTVDTRTLVARLAEHVAQFADIFAMSTGDGE